MALALVVTLGVVVPITMLIGEDDAGRGGGWLVSTAVMVLAAIRIAQLSARGDVRVLEFVFWTFVYVFLGLAAAVQMRTNTQALTTPGVPPDYDMPTNAAVVLGVAAFMIGVALARSRHPGRPAHPARPDAEINVRAATALSVVGVAFAAYYISQVGIGALLTDRATLDSVVGEQWGDLATASIVFSLAVYPLLVGTLSLLYAKSRAGGWARFLSVLGVPLVLLAANPLSSARYVTGSVWGSFLGVFGAFRTRARTTLTLVGIVAMLLFVFPVADVFRNAHSSANRSGFFGEYKYNGDYDAVWQIGNSLAYIDEHGITWGRQLLGSLLFWVPRPLWPDKPVDTGILLAQFRGYDFSNLSAPLWAEALINFGWPGLFVVFLVVGIVVGRADLAAARALATGKWSAVPVAVGSFYFLILLRGSLLQATGAFVVMMFCTLVVRKRVPRPATAPRRTAVR